MTGCFLFLRHALHALADAADMLGDLGMALHARRKNAAVGVPMEDAAGFLDQIVENPLLAVAVETGCTHGLNPSVVFLIGPAVDVSRASYGVSPLGRSPWEMRCPSTEVCGWEQAIFVCVAASEISH